MALAEAIKCEGHLKKNLRQFSLSNENVDFINFTKKLLYKLGIPQTNIFEILRIEVDVPENVKIKKVCESNNEKELSYYLITNKSNKRKIIFSVSFEYNYIKNYKVFTDKGNIHIKVKIPFTSKIIVKSSYGIASGSINITATNITLCKILNLLTEVPTGKKPKVIRLCPLIFNSPTPIKKAAIGIVFAAEGWLEKNRIRIYSDSLNYVKGVYALLKEFGITPTLNHKCNYLSINWWKDLEIFDKNFDLIVKEKKAKLKEILSSKKRFKHGEGLSEIFKFIKEKKIVSVREISAHLNKSKDDIWHHLKNAEKEGFILKHTHLWLYKFSLTKKGDSFYE